MAGLADHEADDPDTDPGDRDGLTRLAEFCRASGGFLVAGPEAMVPAPAPAARSTQTSTPPRWRPSRLAAESRPNRRSRPPGMPARDACSARSRWCSSSPSSGSRS